MSALVSRIRAQRLGAARRFRRLLWALGLCLLALVGLTLTLGHIVISPAMIWRVLTEEDPALRGIAFALFDLRLPRVVAGALAGAAFGAGGAAFQTMLRNPLASPDIIGVSAGASMAAVIAIIAGSLGGVAVSVAAVAGGLGVALLIYLLSWREGLSGPRMILIGIGLSAMAQSVTAFFLSRAPSWSLQDALRWMTGSLNGIGLAQSLPLALVLLVLGAVLLGRSRDLEIARMGDDLAQGLGVRLVRSRIIIILAAVGLVACATALTGPIAFVAFLSGPISAQLLRRSGASPRYAGLPAAALTGAVLVCLADYVGQVLLPARYPVGIITGVLGAPYLVYLIARGSRAG